MAVNIEALMCPQCGGPLPRPPGLPAILECGYCGAAISVSPAAAAITRPGAPDAARDAATDDHRRKFFDAVRELIGAGHPPEQAVREAAATHLGLAGQSDTVARVSLALCAEFERESGISVKKDAGVLARFAQAYLQAATELRTASETEMNLPFLSADQNGPKHFQRRVTAASLAALIDATISTQVVPAAAPAPIEEEPKKKKWWQF